MKAMRENVANEIEDGVEAAEFAHFTQKVFRFGEDDVAELRFRVGRRPDPAKTFKNRSSP
jgi:hypothetical protein